MKKTAFLIFVFGLIFFTNSLYAATYDATGKWNYSVYSHWTECPEPPESSESGTAVLIQTANTFILVFTSSTADTLKTVNGTINGAVYKFTDRYWEDDGWTNDTVTFTLSSSSSGSGSGSWNWSGDISCSGGYSISMTRQAQAAPVYNASGTWDFNETGFWNRCNEANPQSDSGTITINQNSNRVSATDSKGGSWKGFVSGKTYTFVDSYGEDNGISSDVCTINLGSASQGSGQCWWAWDLDGNSNDNCDGGSDISISKQQAGSKAMPWLPLLLIDDGYTFNGGTINQLRAVSPTLEFSDLTINGELQIPESESNVTLDVNNLYLNAPIRVSHPTCKPFTGSPNLTINASGEVRIDAAIYLNGHSGDRLAVPPYQTECNDCYGEDGGNLNVNATNLYVNKGIDTYGGLGLDYYTGDNSGSPYNIDIRYGCDGGDGGNITLNASGNLTIGPEAADFDFYGGSGGSGSPAYVGGVDGTDGSEGVLSWSGTTITVAEDPGGSSGELNMYIANAQILDYKKMTLNGRVGKNEESNHRDLNQTICITFTPGVCGDWVEDFFLLDLKQLSTVRLILSPADSRADLDLYLINRSGTNIISQSNGAGGNESLTSPFLTPGKYLVGVSFADDDPDYITTNYTLKFNQ